MVLNMKRDSGVSEKRGALIVESAIIVPIFVAAVCALCFLVYSNQVQIMAAIRTEDEIAKYSVNDMALFHAGNLEEGMGNIKADIRSVAGFSAGKIDGMEFIEVIHHIDTRIPAGFADGIDVSNGFTARKWNGMRFGESPFTFSEMENDESGKMVFVFPKEGEKYHKKGCRYLKAECMKRILNNGLRKEYMPCPLCMDGPGKDGDTVYVFRLGNSFHSAQCGAVKRNTVCMDRTDAILKGYSACSVCGG